MGKGKKAIIDNVHIYYNRISRRKQAEQQKHKDTMTVTQEQLHIPATSICSSIGDLVFASACKA